MEQTNNPFGGLDTTGLEAPRDTLGGGGALESGVYDGVIKLAYAGVSRNGARSLTIHLDINGREYRETLYVTNREGKNYYERNKKKNPLPGFTVANDLALLTTGLPLSEQDIEERVVKLYDFDAKAEVPTKVLAVISLHGKPVKVGIIKEIVDKNVKNGAGEYVPSGETREQNTIDKVFHAETGKTVAEYTNKVEKAEFIHKWEERNKGQTRDRSTAGGAKTGVPGLKSPADTGKPQTKSLFG